MDSFEYVYESVFENLVIDSRRLEEFVRDGHTALFICPDIWKMANDYSFRYDYGDEPKGGKWEELQTTGIFILTKNGVLVPDSVLELVTHGSESAYETVSTSAAQNDTPDTFAVASIAVNRLNVSTNLLFTNLSGGSSNVTLLDNACNNIMKVDSGGFVFTYAYLDRDGSGIKTTIVKNEHQTCPTYSPEKRRNKTEMLGADCMICRITFKTLAMADGSSLVCSFTR